MVTFKDTKGNEYKICFSYEKELVNANPQKAKSRPHQRPFRSICRIIDTKTNEPVTIQSVVVHPKVNFSYEGGRKWALKRALENAEFTTEDRRAAWERLRNMGK